MALALLASVASPKRQRTPDAHLKEEEEEEASCQMPATIDPLRMLKDAAATLKTPTAAFRCVHCDKLFRSDSNCKKHEESCSLRPLKGEVVGRCCLVPRHLWPDEPCNEANIVGGKYVKGAGWAAVVLTQEARHKKRATVRFLKTKARDEHLLLDVLQPMHCNSAASVNDPGADGEEEEEAADPEHKAQKAQPARKARPPPLAPLTATSADVARVVLVPRSVWPRERCTEEGGRGWRCEVVQASKQRRAVLVRFLNTEHAAEDAWLRIDVLVPLSAAKPEGGPSEGPPGDAARARAPAPGGAGTNKGQHTPSGAGTNKGQHKPGGAATKGQRKPGGAATKGQHKPSGAITKGQHKPSGAITKGRKAWATRAAGANRATWFESWLKVARKQAVPPPPAYTRFMKTTLEALLAAHGPELGYSAAVNRAVTSWGNAAENPKNKHESEIGAFPELRVAVHRF